MGYKSIVLNLGIDGMVAPVIKLGVDLAQRFDARLIGLEWIFSGATRSLLENDRLNRVMSN
ncbi:hypothetical protein [Mesorhizobium sp. INR15]|uniref:hypothetical protein n=1 Tax=Mesorhizobium sp. INR15 TaxID=2654248 RepID=UPI001896A1C4|nr:hypothetical protein [Mesorhizobium sp. INR15]QPC95417.1 hypothetical protein GA829_32865 [Mesorhizobium sp. INR15]